MKNLLRVVLCLSVVFVLTKIGKNGRREYMNVAGAITEDANQAFLFPTVKDAYSIQIISPDSWEIQER